MSALQPGIKGTQAKSPNGTYTVPGLNGMTFTSQQADDQYVALANAGVPGYVNPAAGVANPQTSPSGYQQAMKR